MKREQRYGIKSLSNDFPKAILTFSNAKSGISAKSVTYDFFRL